MKKLSGFYLLHTERAFVPTVKKGRRIGIGWRSLSDMDDAADNLEYLRCSNVGGSTVKGV